jgi:flagellar protein FlaG
MRIGDVTVESGVKWERPAAEERPAVTLPQKIEVQQPREQAKPAAPVEMPQMEAVTKQIDSFLRSIGRSIQFSVDATTGRTIISVRDATTGEVIRQVPGEDALKLAQSLENSLSMMLDETV